MIIFNGIIMWGDDMNIREECYTMPDTELRKTYKGLLRTQKIFTSIPFVFLFIAGLEYGILGWVGMSFSFSKGFEGADYSILGFINYVIFAFGGLLFSTMNEKTCWKVPIGFAFIMVIKGLLFYTVTIDAILMLSYLCYGAFVMTRVVGDLNFMRGLENFPFIQMKSDIAFSGMTRDRMLEYLKRCEKGRIYSTDYDKILDGTEIDEKQWSDKETEDYLQQHSITYGKRK